MKGRKTGGRQAGTPNKVTAQAKALMTEIVEAELKRLPDVLETFTDIERVQLLLKLMPYILPKADNTNTADNNAGETFLPSWIRGVSLTSRIVE